MHLLLQCDFHGMIVHTTSDRYAATTLGDSVLRGAWSPPHRICRKSTLSRDRCCRCRGVVASHSAAAAATGCVTLVVNHSRSCECYFDFLLSEFTFRQELSDLAARF
jgi:hypothetical protein